MKKLMYIFLLTIFGIVHLGCTKDGLSYKELKAGMQNTYVGVQYRGPNEFYEDEEVSLLEVGDSTFLINGKFQDSLVVRIVKVNYSDETIQAEGFSVPLLIYAAKPRKLYIQHVPGSSVYNTFEGYAK